MLRLMAVGVRVRYVEILGKHTRGLGAISKVRLGIVQNGIGDTSILVLVEKEVLLGLLVLGPTLDKRTLWASSALLLGDQGSNLKRKTPSLGGYYK